MPIKRSQRLQLIVDLAKKTESQAAKNLQLANRELLQEKTRLADVQQYYDNYNQEFSSRTQALRAHDISNMRTFLAQIDKACKAQALQLEHCKDKVARANKHWQMSHFKSGALENLQSEAISDEESAALKIEQKIIDDIFSSSRHL